MGLCSTASLCIFLSALHSVLAISETVKTSVKSGKTKFSCTLTLVSDGAAVVLGDSKAVCTPNKPAKKKVKDLKVSTDTGEYTLSFNINPEKITKATIGKFVDFNLNDQIKICI